MSDVLEVSTPELDLDPFSDEFLSEPYRLHEIMREAGPVVRLTRYGILGFARYADIRSILLDWQTFCSSSGVGITNFRNETPWRPPSVLLEADPPLHDRTRGVLNRIMSPGLLRSLLEKFEHEADVLVDELAARGEIDAVVDLAERYPVKVFSDAMGLPEEGREHLLAYSNIGFNAFGPRNTLFLESMEKGEAAIAWAMEASRRESFAPSGFGALICGAVDTGDLSEEEAFLIVRGFLTAGMDTTVSAIGNAIMCFAQYPDQWALLRANPDLARATFEETIRYETPIQTLFRTTARPVEFGGVRLEEGEKIFLSLGSANRDPRKWDEPDRFNIGRRSVGHVGFGAGVHVCAGQMIARMEGESILSAVARRISRIELAGQPQHRLNNTLRSLSSLPVRLSPA
jgi:4-methoxybenzoate monooxygenase (O-demethylating)